MKEIKVINKTYVSMPRHLIDPIIQFLQGLGRKGKLIIKYRPKKGE